MQLCGTFDNLQIREGVFAVSLLPRKVPRPIKSHCRGRRRDHSGENFSLSVSKESFGGFERRAIFLFPSLSLHTHTHAHTCTVANRPPIRHLRCADLYAATRLYTIPSWNSTRLESAVCPTRAIKKAGTLDAPRTNSLTNYVRSYDIIGRAP